jgi:predicted neuraminidase
MVARLLPTLLALALSAAEPLPLARPEVVLSDGYGPECHASTLAKLPDGTLVAAWFSGTREGADDVVIRFTRRDAATKAWSKPRTVAEHAGIPCWNPVLVPSADGSLTLFYKVAKHIPDWEGWARRSQDGGVTWSEARRLPVGFLGPIRARPLTLADGSLLCGSSTESAGPGHPWRAHFERCADLGKVFEANAWSRSTPAPGEPPFNAIQPALADLGDGKIAAFARTREGVVATTRSTDAGRTWPGLTATALPNPNAGLEAFPWTDGHVGLVLNHGKNRLTLDLAVAASDGRTVTLVRQLDAVAKGEVSYPSARLERTGDRTILQVCYTRGRREIVFREFDVSGLAR